MPVNSDRRKEVTKLMPEGFIANREWLICNGLTRHAIDNLIKSGILQSVAHGIYIREGGASSWGDVVYFMQWVLKTDFCIGGVTALELQGMSHYLTVSSKKTIRLYGNDKLPAWVNKVVPGVKFVKHNLSELFGHPLEKWELETTSHTTKIYDWRDTREGLRVSIPERAILEVLNEVPKRISFAHAQELIQGLTSLSPRKLQPLLELYKNFKVRRLFFYLSEKNSFSWLTKLNRDKINMGSGKRVIEKNGMLDKKYQITVPKNHE